MLRGLRFRELFSEPNCCTLAARYGANGAFQRNSDAAKSHKTLEGEQLVKVIEDWAKVMSLEQFFSGVESRARDLPEEQRQELVKLLALAREFVGTQDPQEFFRAWKTPVERYLPLSMQKAAAR